MLPALQSRERGNFSNFKAFFKKNANTQIAAGHSYDSMLEFEDPICLVQERHVFTLDKTLRCWDLFTKKMVWAFELKNGEKILPIFFIRNQVVCIEEKYLYFRVIDLKTGKRSADFGDDSDLNPLPYKKICRIGNEIFASKYPLDRFVRLNLTDNRLDRVSDVELVKKIQAIGFEFLTQIEIIDLPSRSHFEALYRELHPNCRQLSGLACTNTHLFYSLRSGIIKKINIGTGISTLFLDLKEPFHTLNLRIQDHQMFVDGLFNGNGSEAAFRLKVFDPFNSDFLKEYKMDFDPYTIPSSVNSSLEGFEYIMQYYPRCFAIKGAHCFPQGGFMRIKYYQPFFPKDPLLKVPLYRMHSTGCKNSYWKETSKNSD